MTAMVQPAYGAPCVPAGHAVVVMLSAPPAAVTVTIVVEVTAPEAFAAVKVYVVVTEGLTLVDPSLAVDVKVPGDTVTLVAPVLAQLSVLLPPAAMLAGLAVNALITGLLTAAVTVTVAVAVADPEALVAVNV